MKRTLVDWYGPLVLAVFIGALTGSAAAAQAPGGSGAREADIARAEYNAFVLSATDSVLRDWRREWREDRLDDLVGEYGPEALLAPPGSAYLFGTEAIGAHFERLLPRTGEIQASIEDFTASARLAYFHGSFQLELADAVEGPPLKGTHVTVLRRDGDEWRLRAQLFTPSEDGRPWPARVRGPELEPLSAGTVEAMLGARYVVQTFADAESVLARLKTAWRDHDTEAATELFTEDGVFVYPGLGRIQGSAEVGERLAEVIPDVRELHTSILDFDATGRMALLFGGYYLEDVSGEPVTGSYLMVLMNTKGWRIRSLAFSPDG